MITAKQGLDRLKAGNTSFVAERRSVGKASIERRLELIAGQFPFAIILGCSDSRVPAEIIFNQGLGDLFVIRVAGNIVAPSQIGSIEYAAEMFGTPLVVVMGHSNCGAVEATLQALDDPSSERSDNLKSIVERIRPAVIGCDHSLAPEDRLDEAVRANILASVQNLKNGSDIIKQLLADGRLTIVGAEYSLETGCVSFIDV